jgi:hypothetical protein
VEDDLKWCDAAKNWHIFANLFAFSRLYLLFRAFICFLCRVEDDLNGAMPRKTGIFSRIYLLFRALICFFAHLFASFAGWKTI